MVAGEYDEKNDEMERAGLQKTIADVERIASTASLGTKASLEVFLQNARGRVAVLDKRIKDSQGERETKQRDLLVISSIAHEEKALSKEEKTIFSGLLGKEFFTKSDFRKLEDFYTKTWDRLSDRGKDEMSHRVWEGVRRDEYKFTELPKRVREKEMEHAYKRLNSAAIGSSDEAKIPAKDRKDFTDAYEAGKRDEASKVLDRTSFKEQMFRHSDSKGAKQAQAEVLGVPEAARVASNEKSAEASKSLDQSKAISEAVQAEMSGMNLKGVKLAETGQSPSAVDMPSKGAGIRIRSV